LAAKKSNSTPLKLKFTWITARKIVQAVALLGFTIFFVLARRGGAAGAAPNLPMRLDPLTTISFWLANHEFPTAILPGLAIAALAVITGRAWCGWLCPLGTILDVITPKRRKSTFPEERVPQWWRTVKYFLTATTLLAAFFGSLSLLILDPLTIVYRTFASALWPALDRVITAIEIALIQVPFLSGPVNHFDQLARPLLFPAQPVFYRGTVLIMLFFSGIIALNWIVPRFWCRYICPLGGFLGLISKFALLQREVLSECRSCGICSSRCPTGTIDPDRGYQSDPAECTLCLECLDSCPHSAVHFSSRLKRPEKQAYDPDRRAILTALLAAGTGAALAKVNPVTTRLETHLLRPPGTDNERILAACIRCGACIRACPTAALQPALLESGLQGMWTPLLMPRLGFCDYSCNACGQVCPVSAIPRLTLDEKRIQVIGKAYINEQRCIAWADHTTCIVCEEMCPVSEKAIQLEEITVQEENGESRTVRLPHVIRERCIGCGICEYKCPAGGEAAIRVYVKNNQLF